MCPILPSCPCHIAISIHWDIIFSCPVLLISLKPHAHRYEGQSNREKNVFFCSTYWTYTDKIFCLRRAVLVDRDMHILVLMVPTARQCTTVSLCHHCCPNLARQSTECAFYHPYTGPCFVWLFLFLRFKSKLWGLGQRFGSSMAVLQKPEAVLKMISRNNSIQLYWKYFERLRQPIDRLYFVNKKTFSLLCDLHSYLSICFCIFVVL